MLEGYILAIWNKMLGRSFVLSNELCFHEQAVTNDARFTICALTSAKCIALSVCIFVNRVGVGASI